MEQFEIGVVGKATDSLLKISAVGRSGGTPLPNFFQVVNALANPMLQAAKQRRISMFNFKKSLITFAGLITLVGAFAALLPLAGRGQGNPNIAPILGPRKFYLTKTVHDGNEVLTACATGYHMASLWEIFEPSDLRYNTELGFTQEDSGSGPPTGGLSGWIRTGHRADNSVGPGHANCQAWTSDNANGLERGTNVSLTSLWDLSNVTHVSPWLAGMDPCNFAFRVWCVQD
ncbi:MAG TPA: hypothetical protein VGJ48_00625 [Pyrinomonadaceae bacterium]